MNFLITSVYKLYFKTLFTFLITKDFKNFYENDYSYDYQLQIIFLGLLLALVQYLELYVNFIYYGILLSLIQYLELYGILTQRLYLKDFGCYTNKGYLISNFISCENTYFMTDYLLSILLLILALLYYIFQ